VHNRRRSGGAGAGSAMRRRPVVNEHYAQTRDPLPFRWQALVVELGEPSAGLSHLRRNPKRFISLEFEKRLIKFSIMRLCVYLAIVTLVNFGRWWARFNWCPTGAGWGQ
jgi:hypothetical protein